MSSMRSVGIFGSLFAVDRGCCLDAASQPAPATTAVAAVQANSQAAVYDINYAIADWRRLRASQGYAFADYARFVNANPGWPGESGIRRSAEKAMRPGENASTVLAFFRSTEPQSGNGWARLAEANLALGQVRPKRWPRRASAWVSGDLSQYDEQLIFSRFGIAVDRRGS